MARIVVQRTAAFEHGARHTVRRERHAPRSRAGKVEQPGEVEQPGKASTMAVTISMVAANGRNGFS
jgi:hypothetical protein